MNTAEEYQAARAQLLRVVSQGGRRISLVEFTTLPQLQEILAEVRGAHPERPFIEITYDPLADTAPKIVSKIREFLERKEEVPLPLIVLRPRELRATPEDEKAAYDFWQAMNFRRELLGGFPAQVLLCVDPWHIQWLADRALDLWSWLMPKIHLTQPSNFPMARAQSLAALPIYSHHRASPKSDERQWKTLWPELQKKSREQTLTPGDLRRYVFPLFESALSSGNLTRGKLVRDLALGIPQVAEDKIEWHEFNALLACGAADFARAEEHAKKLVELAQHNESSKLQRQACRTLVGIASVLGQFGQSEAAEQLCRQAVSISDQLFGPEHPQTLGAKTNLANTLIGQGRFVEAQAENQAVGKLMEKVFGPEHPETLSCRNNLAGLFSEQGDHLAAEAEHREVLKIRERVSGPEHPKTLSSRSSVASQLAEQGKYAEAEAEHRAVLKIQQRVLGPNHPSTMITRNNLANAFGALGKHSEAESEQREVLKNLARALGPEHPSTLVAAYNLALSLAAQGKKKEALQFTRQALDGSYKVLGKDHPQTQTYEKFYHKLIAK